VNQFDPIAPSATTMVSRSKRHLDWDNGVKLAIGGLALAVGAFFVYVFMPDRLSDPGSLRFVAFGMAASLMMAPLVWALRNPLLLISPIAIMSLGLVYWILLDLLQALYVPEVWDIAPVYSALVTVFLFAFGMYVGGLLFKPFVPKWLLRASSYKLNARQLLVVAMLATGLSFLRFAIPSGFDMMEMLKSLGASRWDTPWARSDIGGWDAFLDHLAYFGYVLPSLAVLMYRLERRVTYRSTVCLIFALFIAAFLAQGGGRRIIGATWGAAGILWILTSKTPLRTMFLVGVTFVPMLLALMQVTLLVRNAGFSAADEIVVEEESGIAVDDNFNRMAQTIALVPSEFPHVGMQYVIWVVSRPVPRVVWPGKPLSHGFDLPGALGKTGVSLTTSVVGEGYLAFGYFGCVLMGLLYGYVGAILATLQRTAQDMPSGNVIYAAGLFALFVGLRSAIELVLFSYVILAWLLLLFALRQFRRT
jgi:hypothetical protein